MSYLDTALGIAGGAMRAYGGAGRRPAQSPTTPGINGQQPPVQPRHEGMMMDYIRQAIHPRPTGTMPDGTSSGLPEGTQIPMGPAPPMAAPPMQPNPYPGTPPITDQSGQQFASGGVVNKPTTAIIGEDGPEMVVPLSGRADARVSPRNIPGMSYGRR